MEEMRAGDPSAKLMVMCIMSCIRGPEAVEGGEGGYSAVALVVVHGGRRE